MQEDSAVNNSKVKNLIIILTLLVIVTGFVIYIFNNEYGYFRTAYDNVRSNIRNLIGGKDTPETTPHIETPDYIGQEDPDYTVFQKYNDHLHSIANNTSDYENSYLTKRLMDNLKELYNSKAGSKSDTANYFTDGSDTPIILKVTKSHITRSEKDIEIPTNIWSGFKKLEGFYTESGELLDGYAYCVVTTEITNTGNNDIGLILTNPTTSLNFMNEEGEIYWAANLCNFISFQPGSTEKHAYYYYNFKSGETITNSFVYTVPVAAFEFFDCCFTVNGFGNSGYPPETSSMILLDVKLENS